MTPLQVIRFAACDPARFRVGEVRYTGFTTVYK